MASGSMDPIEAARRVDAMGWRPRNCVWELTLGCNLRCKHCGSRAGKVRTGELSLAECLDVVDQLADLGCELVTLSGGEPTLKKGWDTIARAITDRDIYVNMVTNGVYRDEVGARDVAARAREAGMCNVAVSVDGPQAIHDHLRGPGSFAATLGSIGHFRAAGLPVAVMTTVSRLSLPHLSGIRQLAMDAGATMWRLQLAKPMGSMSEHRDLAIEPRDLLELMPLLARLKKEGGIHVAVGDSIGYYGPYDKVLRGRGWRGRRECWKGCQAGMQAIGIEADGGVKGCLSLQARWGEGDPFIEGNLRQSTLAAIWNAPGAFAFNRDTGPEALTGGCRACRYGSLCRGGARCVSAAFLGKLTEDPYCWYRVASDESARHTGGVTRWAAAAGTALALSAAGCSTSSGGQSTGGGSNADVIEDVAEADAIAGSDVATDATPIDDPGQALDADDPGPDAVDPSDVAPDATPVDDLAPVDDAGPDATEEEVSVGPEYGVFPDIHTPDATPDVTLDATPDATLDADTSDVADPDAIDCTEVCCECEYGVIPEEVWEKCCAPDPCADACCECDYGDPPPPECCE